MPAPRFGSTSGPMSAPEASPSIRLASAPVERPIRMIASSDVAVAGIAVGGVVAGLFLLLRGFIGYRAAGRITGTSVSRIASLAVGEVLVTGIAEAVELTLISPLQSVPCLYYRSRITEASDGDGRDVFREERAVGFRVRGAGGSVRVFPSRARFDVPDRFDESPGAWGGGVVGLQPRIGSVFAPGPADRDQQIAALLTVHAVGQEGLLGRSGLPLSLAGARAAGLLAATPEEAWGNAAIEGSGIGRPVRTPELDPAANRPPPPDPALAARAAAAFEIAPDALILATSDEVPMVVSLGGPTQVAARGERQFVLGLVGGAVAIASMMALAIMVQGGAR